jgi:uncharacterized protein YndB with AHSA1/START domain
MTEELELTVTKDIRAPRKDVFDAWLDPSALSKFMCPADGVRVSKAETEAEVGGTYLIVMKTPEREIPHHGEYKIIDRYARIAFTWLSEFSQPDSLVTLDFEEIEPNLTRVTLHHSGFPNDESRSNHEGGWSQILLRLAESF